MNDSGFDRLFADDAPPAIGQSIGGYRVDQLLAEGEYCTVYRAIEPGLDRPVVLKILKPGPWVSPQVTRRLRLEGRILAQIKHPNIVQMYGFLEHEGCACLILEYVSGSTLQSRLKELPLGPDAAARFLLRIARGVAAAHVHPQRIVHRDLKPANILLEQGIATSDLETSFGFVKIADFGIAKILDNFEPLTLSGQGQPGTWNYMSPEQIEGDASRICPATDVHALGILGYQLATGTNPFDAGSLAETVDRLRHWPPPPPSQQAPSLPEWYDNLIGQCLKKSPDERPLNAMRVADEIFDRIHAVAKGNTAAVPLIPARRAKATTLERESPIDVALLASSTPPPARRGSNKLQWWLLAAIGILIFTLIFRLKWMG